MDYPGGVQLGEVADERAEHGQRGRGRDATGLGDPAVHRYAVEVFHDEIGRAVGAEEVEHLDNAAQPRLAHEGAALGEEALQHAAENALHAGHGLHRDAVGPAAHALGGEALLDGHALPRVRVDGDVGYAEAALAQGLSGDVAVQAAAVEHGAGGQLAGSGLPLQRASALRAEAALRGVHTMWAIYHIRRLRFLQL